VRLLGKCFAISLVSVLLSLVALTQPVQPTTNILSRVLRVQSPCGRGSTSSIDMDQRQYSIASKDSVIGRIHPPYPSQSLTVLVWKPDKGTVSPLQGSEQLRAIGLRVQYRSRPGTNLHNTAKRQIPKAQSTQAQKLSNNRYYTNKDGQRIHSPAYSPGVPAGATAVCTDGTFSFSQHRSGTCSYHGGVANWL
jgi:hypothetical protein